MSGRCLKRSSRAWEPERPRDVARWRSPRELVVVIGLLRNGEGRVVRRAPEDGQKAGVVAELPRKRQRDVRGAVRNGNEIRRLHVSVAVDQRDDLIAIGLAQIEDKR